MSGFWGVKSKHHNTPKAHAISDARDATLFASGGYADLEHAHYFRHARHVAEQECSREVKRLRRCIRATEHALKNGPGCDAIYDYRGGLTEARIQLQDAYRKWDRYAAMYGSPES